MGAGTKLPPTEYKNRRRPLAYGYITANFMTVVNLWIHALDLKDTQHPDPRVHGDRQRQYAIYFTDSMHRV